MGAWIEILFLYLQIGLGLVVAPYMGAWIEIYSWYEDYTKSLSSHPTWVRGLKYEGN